MKLNDLKRNVQKSGQLKITLVALLGATSLAGCQAAKYQYNPGTGALNGSSAIAGKVANETFNQGTAANKLDILIVNDNSASMAPEQTSLAQHFASFIGGISDMDYQVGMTTTDIDSANYNMHGDLMPWTGTSTKILTPAVPDQTNVFLNSIERPETASCIQTHVCPSGNEQPLGASILAFHAKDTANAGFFRDGVPLALLIVSDEDEMSNAPVNATTAAQVVSAFQSAFGPNKRLATFGIVVQEGDQACLSAQIAQPDAQGSGAFGTRVTDLANLTGGSTMSICAADYSTALAQMSQQFRNLVTNFTLAHDPIAGTVSVTFSPAQNIGYTLNGRQLVLEKSPPAGTDVQVSYLYQ